MDDKVKKVKLVAGLLIALLCVAGLSVFGVSWYKSKPKAEFQCVEFINQSGCEFVGKVNTDYLRGVCFNDCADVTNLSSCSQANLTCSKYIQLWVNKP
jgi:hypothetical protein